MAGLFVRNLFSCTALALILGAGLTAATAQAEGAFAAPVQNKGWFYVQAEDVTKPIFPGSTVKVTGTRLIPGQKITLQRGHVVLNDVAGIADEKGSLNITFKVPDDAAIGLHPVVAIFDTPSHAEIIDLRISEDLPLVNETAFDMKAVKAAPGPYQTAYSAKSDALFLAATQIRPMVSTIQKLNPQTLEVIAEVTPAAFVAEELSPEAAKSRFAAEAVGAFGIAVDDVKGTIWVTNTLHNTLAVYSQDDLSLVKQFPMDEISHSREVRVDGERGRVYVSAATNNIIRVYDTQTLEQVDILAVETAVREGIFASMGMDIDSKTGDLFVVSRRSDELAVMSGETGRQVKVIDLRGARGALAVDYDEASGKAYVAAQESGNLLIVDVASGKVEHEVATGSGALSVAFDASLQQAFVANRLAGTITIVSPSGEIVSNVAAGPHANHVLSDGKGNIFAVNKSADPADPLGDRVAVVTPAK